VLVGSIPRLGIAAVFELRWLNSQVASRQIFRSRKDFSRQVIDKVAFRVIISPPLAERRLVAYRLLVLTPAAAIICGVLLFGK
jgi:hypothetical protein